MGSDYTIEAKGLECPVEWSRTRPEFDLAMKVSIAINILLI